MPALTPRNSSVFEIGTAIAAASLAPSRETAITLPSHPDQVHAAHLRMPFPVSIRFALVLSLCAMGALNPGAQAALPPVQATLDSALIQRTLTLPVAKADVFLIDDTLRYLGLKQESDLFRRAMKRLHYSAKLTGVEPDRTISAREAIARERAEPEESLLRLHDAYYRKNLEVILTRPGEVPYQARTPGFWFEVAPSLWGAEHWEGPKNYSPFYFGVRVSPRQPLDPTDRAPAPAIRVVLDDGRALELQCPIDLHDLARQKVVIDWCGSKQQRKLDPEIVAIAQALAAGRGHLEVSFAETKLDEDWVWLKDEGHEGVDPRAWKAISTSSCFERSDCLKQAVRLVSISLPLHLVILGFLGGGLIAGWMRLLRYSTAAVVKVVVGLCAAGAAIAFVGAMIANSMLGFVVLPFAGFVGGGALAGSLLVCRLMRLKPDREA